MDRFACVSEERGDRESAGAHAILLTDKRRSNNVRVTEIFRIL